jgi:DNA primase
MSSIPDELIEQVRDAADIVHILSEFVNLKRTGSDYRGPCPFHGGTHRNLAVIPKKQMFYCFVCHEGGDVFAFFSKRFGMEYPAAVREVAGKVGITIPERSTGGPDPREPLYSAVGVAAEWYAERLRDASDGAAARDYLASRSFDVERLLVMGLGYAPKGRAFLDAMANLGVAEDVLLEAGLVARREDGSLRPRFWSRLLFPIHDLRGRVVGFGGRVIAGGEPKYLNSPESPIFHKGKSLYNLHNAKNAIRRVGLAIVVEGYFDVLRVVSAETENVVAPLGTALTTDQASLLKRYTSQVTLLYDSDTAGLRASFRAADELLRVPTRVMVATPPRGEDPDSLIDKGGAEALSQILDDALDVFERKLQLIERKGWLASLAGRRRALDRLMSTLRAAKDPVTQDLYAGRAAQVLGVTEDSIRREMASGRDRVPPRTAASSSRADSGTPMLAGGRNLPEWTLIRVMLREPHWRARVAEQFQDLSLLGALERQLFQFLAAAPAGVVGAELLQQVEGQARAAVGELLEEEWGALDMDALVEGALGKLESRRLETLLHERERRLPLAPEEEKPAIAREIDSLSRQIAQLNPGRWNVIRRGSSSAV